MSKQNNNIVWIVSIAIIAIIALVRYTTSSSRPVPEFLPSIAEQYDISIGDQITLTGEIQSDGDLRFYTHSIQTQAYGRVGLKSRTNLNTYRGFVQVQGMIESILNEQQLFVVQVDNVVLLQDEDEQEVDIVSAAQYNRSAGIYFPATFFDVYDRLQTTGANTININRGEEQYSISYFICTSDNTDTDCEYLAESFASTASKIFTISDGMTFYKMSEADSRYTHNHGLIGYFFNDISEQDLLALSRQIDFPTIKSVEQRVLPNTANLCTDGSVRMAAADEYDLIIVDGQLHLAMTGMVGTQTATCEVVIDYTQTYNAVRTQFVIHDIPEQDPSQEEQEVSQEDEQEQEAPVAVVRPTPFDTNVEQFPINLERPFVFTSSRGHTITFPSQNIAFGAVDFDDNVVLAASACYAKQNLVAYTNRSQLQTQPAIIIYECRLPAEDNLPQQYISYPLEEGKNFIVYVVDGARRDFANNMSVGSVE